MANNSHIQTLFAYHWKTTERLLQAAAQLSEAARHENPGYGRGSIHDLFLHLLRTDQSWRLGLETGKQLAAARAEDFATLELLQAGFASEQAAWQTLLAQLTPEEIDADFSLVNWRGDAFPTARWRILHHLILHGMQHHAELAQLLTAHGQSPGDLDFIFFR